MPLYHPLPRAYASSLLSWWLPAQPFQSIGEAVASCLCTFTLLQVDMACISTDGQMFADVIR
jgi:hypothetical protein